MTMSSSYYSNTSLVGTPLDFFDLSMALAPGWRESTFLRQLATALAYWQGVQATGTDPNLLFKAGLAVPWIQAEQARVQSPSINTLNAAVPV